MRSTRFLGVILMTGLVLFEGHAAPLGAQSLPASMEYFSQKPPGRVPEVFAPGIISGAGYRLHGAIVFRPDRREVVWAVIPPAIMSKSLTDGIWSEAVPLELGGRGVQAPAFSADGSRLYYQAAMEGGEGGLDLWWAERTDAGWGPPVGIGPPVNSEGMESQPSLSSEGTLFFTGSLEGVEWDRGIYRSEPGDGGYAPPELLGGSINSEYIDYCPWIAADESYLLFASSRPREEELLHLHVSFREDDGGWSEPMDLHEAIGFEGDARFPSVSPDGRFLFFISGGSAYWVDIAPVMELRSRQETARQ
jgi:hypothetical protein